MGLLALIKSGTYALTGQLAVGDKMGEFRFADSANVLDGVQTCTSDAPQTATYHHDSASIYQGWNDVTYELTSTEGGEAWTAGHGIGIDYLWYYSPMASSSSSSSSGG
jgi:hypothetical protein